MSGNEVHARVTAVTEIGHGLASYGKGFAAVLASARRDVNRCQAEFQLAVADSQRHYRAAERRTGMAAAALAQCSEGCGALERDLAEARVAEQEAQRGVERTRQAQARFDRAAAELYSSMRTIEATANEAVASGRKFVQEYAETLTDYLKTAVSR